jgi:hypothetical protein
MTPLDTLPGIEEKEVARPVHGKRFYHAENSGRSRDVDRLSAAGDCPDGIGLARGAASENQAEKRDRKQAHHKRSVHRH